MLLRAVLGICPAVRLRQIDCGGALWIEELLPACCRAGRLIRVGASAAGSAVGPGGAIRRLRKGAWAGVRVPLAAATR